jgi:hypothetical protein
LLCRRSHRYRAGSADIKAPQPQRIADRFKLGSEASGLGRLELERSRRRKHEARLYDNPSVWPEDSEAGSPHIVGGKNGNGRHGHT